MLFLVFDGLRVNINQLDIIYVLSDTKVNEKNKKKNNNNNKSRGSEGGEFIENDTCFIVLSF